MKLKRILGVLLALSLAFCAVPIAASAENADVYGDVTGDGKLDMYDYMMVKSIYFNKYSAAADELARADVYPDGTIDMFDYLAIKSAYFASAEPTVNSYEKLADYLKANGEVQESGDYAVNKTVNSEDGTFIHVYLLMLASDESYISLSYGLVATDGSSMLVASILIEEDSASSVYEFGSYYETDSVNYAYGTVNAETFDTSNPVIGDYESDYDGTSLEEDFYNLNAGSAALIVLGCENILAEENVGVSLADFGFACCE